MKTCSCKIPVILVRIFSILEFSRQIIEKISNIKCHQNLSSGSRVVRCGTTDRPDETNSRFYQFCERV